MADRTVSVALKADVSNFQAGIAKAAASTKVLSGVVDDEMGKMQAAGERGGSKLAQGFNAQMIRHSPLIAAAVAGGLIAGTPAVLAAAGAMFGGIGALALKGNEQVASAWSGLGAELRAGAAADAAVLIPTYVRMANEIGHAFQELRPQMREAFADSRPLVDSLTDGVTGLARNAMPGLVDAVGNAGPVFEGLQSLLEDVGTGLGEMFSTMSDHGGSAGAVMESLGEIIGTTLPIVGELVGTGSELASVVLPPIADALGMVAGIAEDLGPLLPAIVAGFAGMKIAGSITGGLGSLGGGLATIAQNAAMATYNVDGFAGTAAGKVSDGASKASSAVGKMSGALSSAGALLPLFGTAVALVASEMSDADAQTRTWAQGILDGGQAAADAYAGLAEERAKYGDNWIGDLSYSIDQWAGLATGMDDVKQEADALYDAMSPLGQAQQDVTKATNDLASKIGEYGRNSPQARDAALDLAAANSHLAVVQGDVETATTNAANAIALTPGTYTSVYDSLTTYAAAMGLSKDKTEELRTKTEELGSTLGAFVDPLGSYTGLLEEKKTADQEAAQATADATKSQSDSWKDYVTAVDVSLDEYMVRLEQQVTDQTNWQTNMLILAGKVSSGTIAELARMGPEGAPLVADLVNASDAELDRFDEITAKRSKEATDAWGAQLTLAAPVLAEVGRRAGSGVVEELAAQLQAGTITVGQIAAQYGITLANGVNPVLKSLGKPVIEATKLRVGKDYWSGGFTGPGGKYTPAGIVHANEYVEPSESVNYYGTGIFEALHERRIPREMLAQLTGYANGGFVTAADVPRPYSTAPYGVPISTAGDATMQKGFDEVRAFLNANAASGPLGNDAVGGSWQALWAKVHAQFPTARKTSDYRPGDPGYHGKGKAVDVAGARPGDAAAMMAINRWAAANFGGSLAELIYTPGVNLYRGKPHTYNAATRADHYDHVHMAAYRQGTPYVPEDGPAYLHKGEAVIPASVNSREFSGSSSGSSSTPMTVPAPQVHIYLDGQEWRGMARVEAESAIVGALTGISTAAKNGRRL